MPPPYFNTVRYRGVFASRNKLHRRLPLPPPPLPGPGAFAAEAAQTDEATETAQPFERTAPTSQAALPLEDTDSDALPPGPAGPTGPAGLHSTQTYACDAASGADPSGDTSANKNTQDQPVQPTAAGANPNKGAEKPPAPSKHSRKNTGWAALLMRAIR